MNSTMLYICADDYGMSEETCSRIEKCIKDGALNKISVFPNGKITNLKKRFSDTGVVLSIHINLVEGKSVANPENLNLLVSDNGYFKNSFGKLFFLSLSTKRKEFEKQVYIEIKEQIKCLKAYYAKGTAITLDSHQHIHMIPLIFKTLVRVIKDEKIDVEYLRYPTEPIMPYLLTPSLYLTYKPVNLIKQWLLKILGMVNRKELIDLGANTAYFMGILFSGNMDEKRVNKVLVHYLKLAKKNNKDIELLFHPGYVESENELFDENKKSFNKFYLSRERKTEFDTLINMKEACEYALY